MTRSMPLATVLVAAMISLGGQAAQGDFIGVNWNGDAFVIDGAGASLPLGPTGHTNLNSLAKDSAGNLRTTNDSSGGPPRIIDIDSVTGVGTPVGLPFLNNITALAYSADDTLYTLDGPLGVKRLYILLSGGSNTLIGQLPFSAVQGMTFAPDGTLYGWDVSQGLIIIDPETADATNVSGQQDGNDIQSLAFGPDGTLYGVHDQLFTIDLATGQHTLIGPVGLIDIRGFEWVGRIGGCCDDTGSCIGDMGEIECDSQGAAWHPYASCGDDPDRPPPSCNVAECIYDNGPPLDDTTLNISQYAADFPFSGEVADDFILQVDGDNACLITSVTTWVGFNGEPTSLWNGVRVTIYDDGPLDVPSGLRADDGSFTGTVVYTELVDIAGVTATPFAVTCLPQAWTIDVPLAAPGIVLEKGHRYWLVLQPEVDIQFGFATILPSQHSNGLNARQHLLLNGTVDWTENVGNIDGCPPDTPPSQTRRDIAFVLHGEKDAALCLDIVTEQVVCHGDGSTFTYTVEGINTCTGGMSSFSFTAGGGAAGQELCFTILVNADSGFCCSTEICVTIPDCTPVALPSDLDGDGVVGIVDFLALLAAWGSCSDCGTCPADFDGDCSVGILDLLILLGNWG